MKIKEYRILLPFTVEEYEIGQLYSIAEASKNETGNGEGIEVLKNEPFENVPLLGGKFTSGQYTCKIYHLSNKVPTFIRHLAPKGCLKLHEEAWNAYPYCKTILTYPYFKSRFTMIIETMHCQDRGDQSNVHELPSDKLLKREVDYIDIANDPVDSKDYKREEDPTIFKSEKTGRGPLSASWAQTYLGPIMCAYKLVTTEFSFFGIDSFVETIMQDTERRVFLNFNRQVFCWIDNWYGMTMQDIRQLEEKLKEELDEERNKDQKPGSAEAL